MLPVSLHFVTAFKVSLTSSEFRVYLLAYFAIIAFERSTLKAKTKGLFETRHWPPIDELINNEDSNICEAEGIKAYIY